MCVYCYIGCTAVYIVISMCMNMIVICTYSIKQEPKRFMDVSSDIPSVIGYNRIIE